ncbi:anti-sigma factor [Kibdelosporangium aridum]|uniref:Regulator of SigK n=1 Tax=Kibdelosporangium aridum TaxID=2030 RepID=A0A1W2FVL9_KIBAR|nr:anti-sigma factor [Kibdelosporangium aridum]SMD25931.1 Anti-sigma-K factor RskA [Kibdelosporangium aridum]
MTVTHEAHTLTGAYVLDALSDTERRAFEHHMSGCPACSQEVAELGETTTRLAVATLTPVPPALWQKVYAAIGVTRQLPPSADVTPASHPARRQRGLWPTRIAVTAAAAAVLAAVALGIPLNNRANELERQLAVSQSQLDDIKAVLGATDAEISQQTEPDGRAVTMVISRQANGMLLMARGLPELPPTQSFQAWFVNQEGKKTSAGLLNSHGTLLATDVAAAHNATFLALTVEPREGSATPTGSVVLTVPARS